MANRSGQPAAQDSEKNYNAGHRSRVRQRFINNGFAGMFDYEVLEAMLMMALPRKDVKPLAKRLLAKYKIVLNVISAPQDELEQFPGLGKSSAASLRMFFECMQYCLQEKLKNSNLLKTPEQMRNFVRMKLGVHRNECYMIVLLNSRNYLIDYSIVAEGTVDMVLNYPRNLATMALNMGACKILLVHNHPSGVCEPSQEDIEATKACCDALATVGVEVADHLIVTPTECFSFLDSGFKLKRQLQGGRLGE